MYKILFTEETEVGFKDPETLKKAWYASYYGKGTQMEVLGFHSGNPNMIHAVCLDGELAILNPKHIRIECLP